MKKLLRFVLTFVLIFALVLAIDYFMPELLGGGVTPSAGRTRLRETAT